MTTTSDWFKIEAKAKGSKEASKIFIYATIGDIEEFGDVSARAFVTALEKIDSDQIQLHINSPGGNFFEAMAIYNSLRRHPANVTSIVDGYAASAASLVALAGDEVIMAQGSQMMIHNAAGIVMGGSDTMRKIADDLDKVNASMAGVYASKAGGKQDDWREPMQAETWYTAQEAVDAGLADRVEALKPPAEVNPQANFDLSGFRFAGREKAPQPRAMARSSPPAVQGGSNTPTATAAGSDHTEGAGHMDPAKLREALELKPDASEEEVRAAAIAAIGFPAAPTASADQPQVDLTQPDFAKQAEAMGFRLIENGQWAEVNARIDRQDAFIKKAQASERDKIIDEAISQGKIAPANRPTWVASWDANPEVTKATIDTLTPNVVPVAEVGYGKDLDEDETDPFAGMEHSFRELWPQGRR